MRTRGGIISVTMPDDILPELDRIIESGDHAGSLDFLIEQFRRSRKFSLVFEARLMRKRLELGLPLIQTEASSEFPADQRIAYDQAVMEAARETGELFLADGDIERAWPYFRAIGETGPIAVAIEQVAPGENLEGIIAIAFQEGVHPAKGLQLILAQHGMCRAITSFGMYPVQKDRAECISVLTRSLHAEVVDRLARTIESREGIKPDSTSIVELIGNREWLFGEYDYYVDTSHLVSLLPYCVEVTDPGVLRLFHELCAYGKRLSPQFQSQGQPPFENPYVDYGEYVQARLGCEVDDRIAHFRRKVTENGPEQATEGPAQVLIGLLTGLGRYEEALEISLEYLGGEGSGAGACPSALQICYLSKNYDRLKELAGRRGDLLTYAAAGALRMGSPGGSG